MALRLDSHDVLRFNGKGVQDTVRTHYLNWRKNKGFPTRCDIETCQFYCNELVWNDSPLPLILDHVDGNKNNNSPQNLRLVCPNCNSQLPTTGGGNKGRIFSQNENSYKIRDGNKIVHKVIVGTEKSVESANEISAVKASSENA